MNITFTALCQQLAAAGLNALVQGLILAGFVTLCLRCVRRTNAATRYAIWLITLAIVVALFPANLALSRHSARSNGTNETHAAATPTNTSAEEKPFPLDARSGTEPQISQAAPEGDDQLVTAAEPAQLAQELDSGVDSLVLSLTGEVPLMESSGSAATSLSSTPPAAGSAHSAPQVPASQAYFNSLITTATRFFQRAASTVRNFRAEFRLPGVVAIVLFYGWLFAAGLRLGKLGLDLIRIVRLKRASALAHDQLAQVFDSILRHSDMSRNVELRISDSRHSPGLVGFFSPAILVPSHLREIDPKTNAILHHELAHARRFDDWTNLAQHLCHALFTGHPAVWWVGRQLALEREIACDDQVLQRRESAPAYATALLSFAERTLVGPASTQLAPGISVNKTQLMERINMILNTQRDTSGQVAKTRLGVIGSGLALTAVLAIYAAPRFALAQQPPAPVALQAQPGQAVSVGPAPRASVAFAADVESDPIATPAPPDVPTAPKAKPGDSAPSGAMGVYPLPPGAMPRALPMTPGRPAPAFPPVAAVAPAPMVLASHPGGPYIAMTPPPGAPDSSIEERLQRLEQMVESLAASQDSNKGHKAWAGNQKDSELKKQMARDQAKKAEAQVADAQRGVEQMVREQEKMARDQAKMAEEQAALAREADSQRAGADKLGHDQFKRAQKNELEALRHAREKLSRELERLDSQIERLQQRGERSENDVDESDIKADEEKRELSANESADVHQENHPKF